MNRSAEPLLGPLRDSRFAPSWGSALRPRVRVSTRENFVRGILSLPSPQQGEPQGKRRPRYNRIDWTAPVVEATTASLATANDLAGGRKPLPVDERLSSVAAPLLLITLWITFFSFSDIFIAEDHRLC